MSNDLTEELEDEYFEHRAEEETSGERIEYMGVDGSDFVFHREENDRYLLLGVDHICSRILNSDAAWPEYIPQEIESDPVQIDIVDNSRPPGMFAETTAHVDDRNLPQPLEMSVRPHGVDPVRENGSDLAKQVKIAKHLKNNDRRATGQLGEPEEIGNNHVGFPFSFDGLDVTLDFKFPRPENDLDSESFDRLVKECGGSPAFVPGTVVDVIPFQDTRDEIARDDDFELWALVPHEEPSENTGLIDKIRAALR